jgi:hypothetical protein
MWALKRPSLVARCSALVAGSWLLAAGLSAPVLAQAAPDIDALLARVGERLAEYYERAQNIICIEKSTAQPIRNDFSPIGFAQVVESELHIESDASAEGDGVKNPSFVRELRKINGRVPHEKDKKDRSRCGDPNPLSMEPLAFLLPANREGYRFALAGAGKGKDSHSFLIDYTVTEHGTPELRENAEGIEECYGLSFPATIKGRVWVDDSTYEILRVEQHITGPVDIRVSFAQQRKHNLPDFIVVERWDTVMHYKVVPFRDPDEKLLLPDSIETTSIVRGLESRRRRQQYSEYRRFTTGARVVK